MAPELIDNQNGTWTLDGARIIDRAGDKRLPVGDDGFSRSISRSVLVDKTMLIADVIDSDSTVTLFCRPRRFGKTLNMTMLKSFFEGAPGACDSTAGLFKGCDIWESADGRYREFQGMFPVIFLSFRTAKGLDWQTTYGALRNLIIDEYNRHAYLAESPQLSENEKALFARVASGVAAEDDIADSLLRLAVLLRRHHGERAVVLIDEYDAPVMAGFSAPGGGYYNEVVAFVKRLLTGVFKDGGEALAFGCLTGVQRISKESIFSDLNNLTVSTALSRDCEDRFGFTLVEVRALAAYLGVDASIDELRAWYDGYRFGDAEVYNPWSVINYFKNDGVADVYWGNTSGNSVIGSLVSGADEQTLADVYELMRPGGTVLAPLDLSIVFPDASADAARSALWSMLYLAGYLTTEDVALPNNTRIERRLRIPNAEIAELYRKEIVERFAHMAEGSRGLGPLHSALASGDVETVRRELAGIVSRSASTFDLVSENSVHMLVLGLLFGMRGYGDPVSNREQGLGRFDIRVEPQPTPFFEGRRPLMTVELKFEKGADDERLVELAREALEQVANKRYDDELPALARGRVRWGLAFAGKRVAVAAEVLD